MRKKTPTKTSKTCEGCSRWDEVKKKIRVSKLLEKAIGAFEKRLEADELKLTTAEYLKLLQLEQEIREDSPREIKVTWVETPEESES
jgi:hypothetical protein